LHERNGGFFSKLFSHDCSCICRLAIKYITARLVKKTSISLTIFIGGDLKFGVGFSGGAKAGFTITATIPGDVSTSTIQAFAMASVTVGVGTGAATSPFTIE